MRPSISILARSTLSSFVASSLVLTPCAAGAVAPAPPPTTESATPDSISPNRDEIDAHVEAGMAKYEAKDYVGAAAEFKSAYELEPDPNFLYNIGRTYEEGAQLELAVEYYRRFAQQPGIELELRKQAVDRIKVLEEVLEQTKPKEPVVEPPPLEPEPPEPSAEPPQPIAEPSRPPGRGLRLSGYVLLGVGISALAAGGVVGGLARRDAIELETTDAPQAHRELIDGGGRKALAADMTFVAGGAIAATGLVLLLVGVAQGRKQGGSRAAMAPVISPQLAGAALGVRF